MAFNFIQSAMGSWLIGDHIIIFNVSYCVTFLLLPFHLRKTAWQFYCPKLSALIIYLHNQHSGLFLWQLLYDLYFYSVSGKTEKFPFVFRIKNLRLLKTAGGFLSILVQKTKKKGLGPCTLQAENACRELLISKNPFPLCLSHQKLNQIKCLDNLLFKVWRKHFCLHKKKPRLLNQ